MAILPTLRSIPCRHNQIAIRGLSWVGACAALQLLACTENNTYIVMAGSGGQLSVFGGARNSGGTHAGSSGGSVTDGGVVSIGGSTSGASSGGNGSIGGDSGTSATTATGGSSSVASTGGASSVASGGSLG